MPIFLAGCAQTWSDDQSRAQQAARRGDFAEAEKYFRRAADGAARAKNPKGSYESLLGLARTLLEEGKYREARPLFETLVKAAERNYGAASSQTAAVLVELAACLYSQQEFTKAEPLCVQAIDIERAQPKPNRQLVVTALNNLAEIKKRAGHEEQAERYYKEAIAMFGDPPEAARAIVDAYSNLAMLYKRQGRYALAEEAIDHALKLQNQLPKSDLVGMASVLNAKASIERAQFDNQAAAKHYQDAISLLEKREKSNEEPLCDTLDNYADLLLDEREYERAEGEYIAAVEHCKNARGPNHPCVAERMVDLGNMYRRTGQFDKSEAMLKDALRIYSQSLDADSPIVVNTINDLSAVYVDRKKYSEAIAIFEKWLPELEAELGQNHPHVADAIENWAMVVNQSSDTTRAAMLRARAKGIRSAFKIDSKPATVTAGGERKITLDR